MRTTIDKAGRLVIPKSLRDRLGLGAGEVELSEDGASLRVEPVVAGTLGDDGEFLVIPAGGRPLDDDEVQELRVADQA